ncbi:MAG: hypothetical protein E4H11_03425 [Myxococcales bacterium]|nr:MAG: hypothetical protein E4H11_03425 [Myxococcales bacterium]
MRPRVNTVAAWIVAAALHAPFPIAASAQSPVADQESEDRWVASLAVTSGVMLQGQDGKTDACLFANPANVTTDCPAPGSTPLRPPSSANDLAIVAFVGPNLELMTPALPIPTRPRFFVSGEILPTFSADRDLSSEGDPTCVSGTAPDSPCARDVGPGNLPTNAFGQDDALGQGSVVTTTYDTLSFGANLGLAFPVQVGKRRLRIKPSVGWISYEVKVEGKVVDAACQPPNQCTNVRNVAQPGLLRETILDANDTKRFHAIGPGVDIEMDTGRFGPLGTAIFVGGHAYRTLGDRTVEIATSQVYGNDGLPLANQAVSARWSAEFKPWLFRAGVGLRIQWLGGTK